MEYKVDDKLSAPVFLSFVNKIWPGNYDEERTQIALSKTLNVTAYDGEKLIGHTTSGTHCPFVGYPASMAIIDVEYKAPGTVVSVDVRGRRVEAEVVKLPFYKK